MTFALADYSLWGLIGRISGLNLIPIGLVDKVRGIVHIKISIFTYPA